MGCAVPALPLSCPAGVCLAVNAHSPVQMPGCVLEQAHERIALAAVVRRGGGLAQCRMATPSTTDASATRSPLFPIALLLPPLLRHLLLTEISPPLQHLRPHRVGMVQTLNLIGAVLAAALCVLVATGGTDASALDLCYTVSWDLANADGAKSRTIRPVTAFPAGHTLVTKNVCGQQYLPGWSGQTRFIHPL